jgi:hypothetical protein
VHPLPWPESLATLAGAVEGLLAIGARAVGRLSAQANGIRFGTVQRQEDGFRAELRDIRQQASLPDADPAALAARLQALRESVERFAGQWIAVPPAPAPAAAADPSGPRPDVPGPLTVAQVAALRQRVTRAMIALAQAPLHLRLEFGAGFVDPHPDVPLLAARMHAIHRGVRGSLKQICWQAADRVELSFGEADGARTVEAVFDSSGRMQVPDSVRQNPGRGASPGARSPGAAERGGSPPQRGSGSKRAPQPGPQPQPHAAEAAQASRGRASPGASAGNRRPDGSAAGPQPSGGGRPPGQARPRRGGPQGRGGGAAPEGGRPAVHGRRGPPAGPAGRNAPPSSGGAAQARDDRRPPTPRGPINPLMADKLRALLGGTAGAKPASAPEDPPAPTGPSVPPERGSD